MFLIHGSMETSIQQYINQKEFRWSLVFPSLQSKIFVTQNNNFHSFPNDTSAAVKKQQCILAVRDGMAAICLGCRSRDTKPLPLRDGFKMHPKNLVRLWALRILRAVSGGWHPTAAHSQSLAAPELFPSQLGQF